MVFLSCRIVFPADTCTVTVLMPSWENVHATLPSRVITGCWGRTRDREDRGESQSHGALVRDPYHTPVILHFRGVRHIRIHMHTHAEGCNGLCGAAYTVCIHSSNNQIMPMLT